MRLEALLSCYASYSPWPDADLDVTAGVITADDGDGVCMYIH